ncbi:hypothetical protein [Niveibacterium umoris]|uniref:Uncharacterized protein n=1 Tax=Niveibacterium umoris TaxID=1193620 RepID=A0A840BCK4_9RHOO|nr:hypothetical protein [Niveibacterium umoris]MBB4010805.1 hypothetical protein [Niveibacterium umoris]
MTKMPERLADLLGRSPRQTMPARSVSILIGAPWVQYLVLPWQEGLYTAAEWEAFARLEFERRSGIPSGPLRIRVALGAYGEGPLASCVPQSLIDTLQSVGKATGFSIGSIQPMLMHAYNSSSLHFSSRRAPLLLLEDGFATFLASAGRRWTNAVTLATAPRFDIDHVVTQAVMLSDSPSPRVVHVCEARPANAHQSAGSTYNYHRHGGAHALLWPR